MGAADYAREALATLWKALGQLEVGEVGVLRFGDDGGPALLHGMASPLSDALGAQVCRVGREGVMRRCGEGAGRTLGRLGDMCGLSWLNSRLSVTERILKESPREQCSIKAAERRV